MKSGSALLGALALTIFTACNSNSDSNADSSNTAVPSSSVQNLSYSIAAAYPHDTASFTQGLDFYNGHLYEGTGNLGKSKLMQVDLKSGQPVSAQNLAADLFGEGVTVLNDTVYQLTWQNKVVLAYTAKDMKKVKEFPINTEGWGIANDGKNLIVSDGSSNLYYYEPSTFRLLRTQGVTMDQMPINFLNELEFINGFIYANRWQTPYILKIDPNSGIVEAQLDFSELVSRVQAKIPNHDTGTEATLNGIAYDDSTKKIYITGKLWPELYEVQFQH
ncbi:Glutamine cyclotransferase [Cnuella takakiae]|uniref:Glutamine cyclotransferase n=1 Tax=Cnuella takakiae TaxID=1302690 RepID=A0A1M5G6T8_9BACT|nr:glutaminyl-peptide cyclotransferase [Cnuella takakiae]OLY92350.1 glutamine cyclotransferase [Cnuella takakiae]SHF99384.1 Glutamine cyclotransferase [Cnuella takakiae]